jgi:hypothetical protein
MPKFTRQRYNVKGLGLKVEALETAVLPATASKAGLVKQGVAVANAAGAAPTAAEFLALLASLRTAGVIATA